MTLLRSLPKDWSYDVSCWKIYGKPTDQKLSRPSNNRENRGYLTFGDENHTEPEHSLFNKEQIELLQKLINRQPPLVPQSLELDPWLTKVIFKNSQCNKKENHPMDGGSGATDHMIGVARIFNTYSPCHKNFFVGIAYGSLSKVTVTGCGYISEPHTKLSSLSPKLGLQFIVHQ